MERLPHNPQTFRDIVEADLRRAARLAVKIQDEIDPQVRIATPEGDFRIALTFPAGTYARRAVLRTLALFMAWKQAVAFTFASDLHVPDCAANAIFALKAGEWFRRGLLLIAAPDSRAPACPLSGRNSTYRIVRICGATTVFVGAELSASAIKPKFQQQRSGSSPSRWLWMIAGPTSS